MDLTSFHAELFVADLDASIDFYGRVLGFIVGEREAKGYAVMRHGPVTVALNDQARIPSRHPARVTPGGAAGRGVEFVFRVRDLGQLYAHVQGEAWPIADELKRRPWGLEDFCLQDPDGYFLRFTSPATSEHQTGEKQQVSVSGTP